MTTTSEDSSVREIRVGSSTLGMVRDCLDYLISAQVGPYADAADARKGLPSWDEYGNHEPSLYALCWQQEPSSYTACDRMRGHGGKCSWASEDPSA